MEEPPGAGRGTGQSPLRAPGGTGTADTLILDVWLQEREKMNLFEPPGVGSSVTATPEPKSEAAGFGGHSTTATTLSSLGITRSLEDDSVGARASLCTWVCAFSV